MFLHVNAQKELKALFNQLAIGSNQVVYTTHSPYMIDQNDIVSLRAVEKNLEGITKIFNNIYDSRLCKESKMETLSPLLSALGADLKHDICLTSRMNLITEGITDKLYILGMLKYLRINTIPNIIPLVSVNNTRNVMAILLGWGCDFKAILDFDNQGLTEYNAIKKGYGDIGTDNIIFVNSKSGPDEKLMKAEPMTIESLICDEDMLKLNNNYDKYENVTKKVLAKEFYDKVSVKAITLSYKTEEAFRNLFECLGIE